VRFASSKRDVVSAGRDGQYQTGVAATAAIMNSGKSALNTSANPCLARAQTLHRSLLQALHTLSHKLVPFSAFFHKTNIPPALALILHHNAASALVRFFAVFTATHCGSAAFLQTAVVRSCTPSLQSHPIAEPLVSRRPTRASSPSLYRPRVHVVRFCPTSCSTSQCLAQIDWLTCRISSTSPSCAIVFRKPLLFFGAGMHRSIRHSCTS
jgi:hypothetical protein